MFINFEKNFKFKKTEPEQYKQAMEFLRELASIVNKDAYIARSDYSHLIEKYREIFVFFDNNRKSDMLSYYCKKNDLDVDNILKFLKYYDDIQDIKADSKIINYANEQYLEQELKKEKHYLDKILKEVDPAILLDEEQRKVVLSDEDYTLVIAGAGSGKTTTVAAKVRYLVEKKKIDPKQILVISFTNKAVGELRDKINNALKIDCPITTFHRAGYTILKKDEDENRRIVDDGYLFTVVNNYLKGNILEQPELVDKLILFYGSYFDSPYEGDDINKFFDYVSKADFSTLKGNMEEYNQQVIDSRTGKHLTINYENLRSAQEVEIANFLYLNTIDYQYEKPYEYNILKAKKPYTPDFYIRQGNKTAYIEHFGITEDGKNTRYSTTELDKYKNEVNDKIKLHRQHKTNLIYTFSKYRDGRTLLDHLKEELEKNGFELIKRPSQEVFEKIVNTEENKYIAKLVKLICVFISNFKTNNYNLDDFYRFSRTETNVRTKLFLDISQQCYLEYQKKLKERNAVDFNDLINDSARLLKENEGLKGKLGFKYIFVDEYQDISRQRFDLTKELSNLCDAKIIAVGDDWQSIYAYAGSDITLFTKFCEIMGYGKELKITNTYRNAQEVIDIAGNFIQKNESQIKKELISPKKIDDPIIIDVYDEEVDRKLTNGRGGRFYNIGSAVENAIGQIIQSNRKKLNFKRPKILLIGRYGFDARNLCLSNCFVYDESTNTVISQKYNKEVSLEFLTAHRSKGLGFDDVIIINARNEIFGFPSKIDDDPVLKLVTTDDHSIEYAEERRLFYVALTRTKNRVYIITPKQHPSEFVLELVDNYKNVKLNGELLREEKKNPIFKKECPICGYPLLRRFKKNYGLGLLICSNEPEICNFITNNLAGGKMQIQKCDWCKDGYLVVKIPSNKEPILGCTNYKSDGTGCTRLLNSDAYEKWITMEYEDDTSADKPSYRTITSEDIPLRKKKDEKHEKIESVEKKPRGNVTSIQYQMIEKEGFNLITNGEGKILTDEKVLAKLIQFRSTVADFEKKTTSAILTNDAIVQVATFFPTTKEELSKYNGIGEVTLQKYGDTFLEYLKKIIDEKDKDDGSSMIVKGMEVHHSVFGNGYVSMPCDERNRFYVRFRDSVKMFQYPDAIKQGFIKKGHVNYTTNKSKKT